MQIVFSIRQICLIIKIKIKNYKYNSNTSQIEDFLSSIDTCQIALTHTYAIHGVEFRVTVQGYTKRSG